jgi:hypothetical protein
MIALAAVKKYHSHDSIVSLNENLHWRTYLNNNRTGHCDFDALLKDVDTYAGECQYIDDVSNYLHNNTLLHLKVNDFHHSAYQCCAINVTNESFYNSDGWEANGRCFTYPGPFLTEKTLKCLLGETAFIANGQFQTYSTLCSLGFEFDYGLNLSYDNIKPDLDRLIAMFGLIQSLQSMGTMEIFENTRTSCLHNKEHVLSGKFYSISEKINQETVQYIYNNI